MAKAGGRGKRKLNKRKKGRGIGGGKWGHGFKPKNAVARQLKAKTYRKKGKKRKTASRRGKSR